MAASGAFGNEKHLRYSNAGAAQAQVREYPALALSQTVGLGSAIDGLHLQLAQRLGIDLAGELESVFDGAASSTITWA